MVLDELRRATVKRFGEVYPRGEALWLWREMLMRIKGWGQVELAIKAGDEVSEYLQHKVEEVTERLLRKEPVQYIFGIAEFYGLQLKVTPDVLIPRPETAEMVDMIVKWADGRTDLRVLDLCTGSGCIAVALARNLKFAQISAIDLSSKALAVAAENVKALKVKVNLKLGDALQLKDETSPKYDIIVSNPPYIAESERASMDSNVVDHEPQMALFVPDSDPLMFYHAIARYAMTALVSGGVLYFEINPLYAIRLREELQQQGWDDVVIEADMQGLNRFIHCVHP